ncbi:hypothetical protein [Streptomyces griseosporeus]|uniref:hypothetical protein n=1 Tax=Streptomyces griseosporeus TaxID=1910 RepID=UPI0036FF3835
MTHQPTGPACGNNPNYRLSDGDRQAVDAFRTYLADRAALRDRIAEALISWAYRGRQPDPETGILETLRTNAYSRADAVLAVLPPPVDRAAVLREAADFVGNDDNCDCGGCDSCVPNKLAEGLRRMAAEAQLTQSTTYTVEAEHTPAAQAEARQDEVWPVKESTRRYAEKLRRSPGQVSADGHTGWDCDAGAQLLVGASTPGPGKLGTYHGTIYACPTHEGAAVERITGAGYEADPRPAAPGHRWDPWPCGHVTAHGTQALTALTAGARQDGGAP